MYGTSGLMHDIGEERGDLSLAENDWAGGAEPLGELGGAYDPIVRVEFLALAARWDAGQETVEVGAGEYGSGSGLGHALGRIEPHHDQTHETRSTSHFEVENHFLF